MMNLVDGKVVGNELKFVDLPDALFEAYRLEYGDILFNRTNSIDLVGKVGIYHLEGDYVFASYLIRLRVRRDRVSADYLNYFLNSEPGQARILAYATPGVSQSNVNGTNLKKVLVPLPPMDEQLEIVRRLNAVE